MVTRPAPDLALDARVREFLEKGYWYHTIEIAGMRTAGVFDHRPWLARYGFPEDLTGKTVLDVGTGDGFFAFELERRGARVVAIDTDSYDGSVGHTDVSPARLSAYEEKYRANLEAIREWADVAEAFGLTVLNRRLVARALLGSSVEFREGSVYDLAAEGTRYDLVFCGDLIEHLKHPLAALENLWASTRELCIVSLSNALPAGRPARLARRAIRKAIAALGLQGYLVEASDAARYVGNHAGGSFFYFHPHALGQALLASGFREACLHAEFDLPRARTGERVRHAIFHCTP